jgi:hypothetical protein
MMRVEDEPQSNHTTWKKAGIILLRFFNAYPVTDAFGTGHTGDDVLLIPLVFGNSHRVVMRILASQEFASGEDARPNGLNIPEFIKKS